MPKYLSIAEQNLAMKTVASFTVQMHNGLQGAGLLRAENGFVPTYFIENDAYFNREGLYGLDDRDYPDNLERFVFFCILPIPKSAWALKT